MNTAEIRKPALGAGILILIVGIWGGIVPFVGPLFSFNMGSPKPWVWSESHATLHVAPAVVAIIGAIMLLRSRRHNYRAFGAVLATIAGAWFVLGPSLHPLWAMSASKMMMGGSTAMTALEAVGYHYGTGILIAVLGAYAFGRLATTSHEGIPKAVPSDEKSEAQRREQLVEA